MKQFIAILLLVTSPLVYGQYHTGASRSELGVLVGGSYYLGDLNQFSQFRNTHLAGGLVFRFNLNPRVSFRANFTYAKVSAEDSKAKSDFQKERNLSFSSDIYELAAGFEFNYFPFQIGHKRYKGTAYLLAELGMFRMNPKTTFNGTEVALRDLGTEGQGSSLNSKGNYGLMQVCVPLGVGVKMSLGNRMGLNFEFGIRKTFTDYLDDVKSDSYVDAVALAAENGPTAAAVSNLSGNRYGQRGNSSTKDWYVFSGMMITIRLGSPAKCYDH